MEKECTVFKCLVIVGALFSRAGGLGISLPPQLRTEKELRRVLEERRQAGVRLIDFEARSALQIASKVFSTVCLGVDTELWLPRDKNGFSTQLAKVNTTALGVHLESTEWPVVPAPRLYFRHRSLSENTRRRTEYGENAEAATIKWVNEVLAGKQLCPYTESSSRAAIGLASERVKPGPVRVRVAANASELVAMVFQEAVNLEFEAETDIATVLVVAPFFDEDPLDFYEICDNVIDTTISLLGATDIIGRAWFHPRYSTCDIYDENETIIRPGHALPPTEVSRYIQRYYPDSKFNMQLISAANNQVRHSPHATVNLLRRSQLQAAQRLEARAPKSKANLIYARNVLRLLADR